MDVGVLPLSLVFLFVGIFAELDQSAAGAFGMEEGDVETFGSFSGRFIDPQMELSHIEHVGIAVPSLDEAIPFYENMLGLKCFAIEEVADQKVRTAFFRVGQTKIELLEGTRANLPDNLITGIEKETATYCDGLQALQDGLEHLQKSTMPW